eukprot:1140407-Pelagomonas_calceolata.AAC.3
MRANQDWETSTELCRPMLRCSASELLLHRASSQDHFCTKSSSRHLRARPTCTMGQLQRPPKGWVSSQYLTSARWTCLCSGRT